MRIRLLTGAILGMIAAQIPLRGAAASSVEGASSVAERQLVAHPVTPFPLKWQLDAQATWPSDAVMSFQVAEDAGTVPGTPPVLGNAMNATPSSPKAKAAGTDSASTVKAPKSATGAIAGAAVDPLNPALDVEKPPSVETTPVGVTIYRGSGAP